MHVQDKLVGIFLQFDHQLSLRDEFVVLNMDRLYVTLDPGAHRRPVGPDIGVGGIDHDLMKKDGNDDADRHKEKKIDKKFSRFFHSTVLFEAAIYPNKMEP